MPGHRTTDLDHYTPEQFAAIVDQAKARAERLRREAQVAFWRGAADAVRRAWGRRRGQIFGSVSSSAS